MLATTLATTLTTITVTNTTRTTTALSTSTLATAFVAASSVAPSSVATASTHTPHRRVPRPQVDYTIDSVIPELTGTFTQESRAAVIRMFGTTAEGNSVMVHVHGFFPYLYVRAPAGFTPAHCEAFRQTLAQRLKGQSQKEPLVNPVRPAAPCTHLPPCVPSLQPCAQPASPRAAGAQRAHGQEAVDHALPVRQRGRLPEDRRGLAADGGHVPQAARAGYAGHGRLAAQLRDVREQLGLHAALHGRPRDHRLQLGDAQGGLLAAAAVDDRVGHAPRQEEPLPARDGREVQRPRLARARGRLHGDRAAAHPLLRHRVRRPTRHLPGGRPAR